MRVQSELVRLKTRIEMSMKSVSALAATMSLAAFLLPAAALATVH